MMARNGLAALLVVFLAVPAGASPSTTPRTTVIPIGAVSSGESTNIGGASAVAGTTVFSGDVIEVGPRGSAWLLLNGGTQVRIAPDSRVRLALAASKSPASTSNPIEIEVFSGTATFRTSEASPVWARLADAIIRAKGARPAVGVVAVRGDNKAMVVAEKGELWVSTTHDAKSVTLREGEAVEATLVPAPPEPGPQGSKSTPGLTGKQLAILGTTIAVIATIIWLKLSHDNKGLTDTQKRNMVSPFQFP